MHDEDYTLNLFPTRKNDNFYSKLDNNYGNDYGNALLYYGYLCGTGIPGKVVFRKQQYSHKNIFSSYPYPRW